jgi:hypothetical protein
MSENVVFKYSEFFEDDGGFKKVLAEFDLLGSELVGKANKYKKDINEAFNTMDLSSLKTLEAQIESSNAQFKQLATAKNDVIKVEKEYNAQLKATLQNEILIERNKQAKIQSDKKEIEGLRELDKAIQQENNTKKSAIALSEAQRRAGESQARSMKVQKGAYSELSAELRVLFTQSANVASEMYQLEVAGLKASPQYVKLSKTFEDLKGRTAKLDGALKQIDSTLGRNQRNVGNYASGYSGINNSINQLTRELPAFTFSAQTGILALSNNIPILTDEIGRLVKTNKSLVAEGKPVTSVFSQIVKGVLSLQTAMGVGILLLTVYGKEIGIWAKSLFGASEALKELTQAQKDFALAKIGGRKDAQTDIIELRKYLAVVKDEKVSMEERNIALKALRSQFPFFFKDLTDAQILSGKYAQSERDLTIALEKRKEVEKKTELNVKNKQKLIDINEEIDLQQEVVKQYTKRSNELSKSTTLSDQYAESIQKLGKEESKLSKLKREAGKYNQAILKNDNDIFKLKKETISLEFQEEKDKQDKIKDIQQTGNVDYLANDFQLRKLLLENTIKGNSEIFGSDKYTLEQRLDAQKNMVAQMLSLAEMEKREALRLLSNKYNEERSETIKDNDGKVIAKKYTNNGLLELEKQYLLDKKIIQETFRQAEIEANKKGEKIMTLDTLNFQLQNLQYLQKNLSDKSEVYVAYSKRISEVQTKINNIINQEKGLELTDKVTVNENELARIEKFRDRLFGTLDKTNNRRTTLKEQKQILRDIEAFEDEKTDIEADAEIQRKLARLYSIEQEKKAFVDNSNEFKQLEIEAQGIKKGLQNDEIKRRLDAEKKANKASLDNFKDFFEDFDRLMSLVLDKLIDITQKRVDQDKVLLENQKKTIEIQQQRAGEGLDNTLAYEQRQLGKRESDLLKREKQEQRLQKIKTIYTSYSGYANQDPDTAIQKTLRDFALLEAITASFGDGGVVEDKLPTNGIFRGQSHKGNNKGIPILVEGREGIFSAQEMDNLGKDNFYKMKDIASMGKVDSNFFTAQRQQFVQSTTRRPKSDPALINEMREVKRAIEGKPVQNWDVANVADGVMELVETVMTKNHVIRNHYTTKKRKI